ncbi:MAG: PucR family transcriptional regulator ligand-binding domain-containing protein [Syntrophomonadaceae bacterium]|nr:PucR family transcriptional regulator ligand-binding domain-containing protein [Syntrophomonadaceae bacterium]
MKESSAFTVREALNLPSLASAKVIAGAQGLDRVIDWFHILDIPQIGPWVNKGDIILCSTYALQAVPEITDGLIENLNAKGVTGMTLALGAYLKEVPRHMIDTANLLGFPLITFNAENKFRDVTLQLSEKILENSRKNFDDYEFWLHKVMDAVNGDEPLPNLMKITKKIVNANILFLDCYGRLLISGQVQGKYSDFLRYFRENDLKRKAEKSGTPLLGYHKGPYFFYRVQRGNQVAFLVVLKNIENVQPTEKALLESIIAIISALLNHQDILKNAALKAQVPLFESILYGQYASDDMLRIEARELGWDLNSNHVVAVFHINNFDNYILKNKFNEKQLSLFMELLIKEINKKISYVQGKYPVIKQDLSFTTIFNLPTPSSEERIFQGCQDIIEYFQEKYGIELFVGLSTSVEDLADFSSRIEEAKETIEIIKVMKDMRIARYDQLGLDLVVNKILMETDIKQTFLNKMLDLAEYDSQHNSDLIHTLRIFVHNRGSLSKTARSLYIHRNTVVYRLKKVEEIMGIYLSSPDTFINLTIILKLYDLFVNTEALC